MEINIPRNILIESASHRPPSHRPSSPRQFLSLKRSQTLHSSRHCHLKVSFRELPCSIFQRHTHKPRPPAFLIMRPLLHRDCINNWADNVKYLREVTCSLHTMEKLIWRFYIFSRENLGKKELRNLIRCRQGWERKARAWHFPGSLRRRRLWVGVERFLEDSRVDFALRKRRGQERAGVCEPEEKEPAYGPV